MMVKQLNVIIYRDDLAILYKKEFLHLEYNSMRFISKCI